MILPLLLGVTSAEELSDDVEGKSATLSSTHGLQDDSPISQEEYSGEYDILVNLDDSLNEKYEAIIEECLSPDEDDSLENLINQTNEYVFLRRRWLGFFKPSPQNNLFHLDKNALEIKTRQLQEAEYIQQLLKVLEIYKRNSKVYSILSPLSLNWGKGFNFEEGENVSGTAAEYLEEFELSFNDLKESIDVLQKQMIAGFPIDSCFNETIPFDYLSRANQIIERNRKVVPFYETAVTYGKIVEPILLAVLTIFGLLGNSLLIYMFIYHKEVGNSRNLMILNLALVLILRNLIELPLNYQQTYYSHNYLVGTLLFNVFRTLFISASAFSVLAFTICQYKYTTGNLYDSSMTKQKSGLINVLTVWTSSFAVTMVSLFIFHSNDTNTDNDWVPTSHITCFAIFGVILPCITAILILLNATRLIRDCRETNEGAYQRIDRINRRGLRVSMALLIVYFIGYVPELARLVSDSLVGSNNEFNSSYHFTHRVLAYLFYSSFCLYPVALCVASGSYRRLFKLYLCRCSISKQRIPSTDIVQM